MSDPLTTPLCETLSIELRIVQALIGSLEFVGPNEKSGWSLAGTIVPIVYVAWSIWLIALGIGLML